MILQKDKPKLDYKLLTYDIETGLLLGRCFSIGEMVMRHTQLLPVCNVTPIISIAYKWYHEDEISVLSGADAVEEFDKLARKADVCLGKNSNRFDVKHINTQRMMQGLKPYPEWMGQSEDIERQIRKYFKFPSYSLDYLSNLFGLGGKVKMEFSDWADIQDMQIIDRIAGQGAFMPDCVLDSISQVLFKKSLTRVQIDGKVAMKKMLFYNKKDVEDTEDLLVKVLPYITLKYNAATKKDGLACKTCGSLNIVMSKKVTAGQTRYQEFECLDHKGYAGRATFSYTASRNVKYGKIG